MKDYTFGFFLLCVGCLDLNSLLPWHLSSSIPPLQPSFGFDADVGLIAGHFQSDMCIVVRLRLSVFAGFCVLLVCCSAVGDLILMDC